MQREAGCYPRQANTILSSLAVWREDVLRCQEQVSEVEQGRGKMAGSQVDRVPCWTLKPGLRTENGGRSALGPYCHHSLQVGANSPSTCCRFCMVTVPFNCLQLLCPDIFGDGGEVGILFSRWPPKISADSRDTLCPPLGFCIPVRSFRASASSFPSIRPPLSSAFGLW